MDTSSHPILENAGKLLGEKASEKFYFDLKWSTGSGQTLLYAASQGNTLDIYRAI